MFGHFICIYSSFGNANEMNSFVGCIYSIYTNDDETNENNTQTQTD